jgi:hypothetical protein
MHRKKPDSDRIITNHPRLTNKQIQKLMFNKFIPNLLFKQDLKYPTAILIDPETAKDWDRMAYRLNISIDVF